jgi:hypothetical protein
VPVAAARQAEVGAADPHPAIGGGLGEHRLDQLRVGPLELTALDQGAARLGDPGGERVAQLLQLAEVEHPRRPGGLDPVRDDHPPEPLGDQPRQLQVELADLAAQLGAGGKLVDLASAFGNPMGDQRQSPRLPLQQIGHRRSLSRLEGRGGNP